MQDRGKKKGVWRARGLSKSKHLHTSVFFFSSKPTVAGCKTLENKSVGKKFFFSQTFWAAAAHTRASRTMFAAGSSAPED
jgi:hypothetical protein